jgi:hypothetical protein
MNTVEGLARKDMSDRAGGYTEYGFTAEFYDHVAPYRERGDVDPIGVRLLS